jgi:glycosyltransferase involved in cell wall biosynthesis
MRILHVISSVNPAGGGPIEATNQFALVMDKNGHHSEIASLDPPDAPHVGRSPLPVHPLGPSRSSYAYSPRFVPWLKANRGHYDIVVVHGIWQFQSFGTWRALRNSSTPYVIYTHGMLDPWFKKRYPLKHLKKWMFWPWSDYRVLRDAQAVLFTCEEERILARKSFWLYRCNETIVSYGIAGSTGQADVEVEEFFKRYPDLRNKRLALFISRIHPKKGCDLLLEAFAQVLAPLGDWHLVIAGPDQVGLQRKLTQRAEALGIASHVTWTGMITGAMKWGTIRAAEIFVLPSHQENFGIVVAEALAAGVPALISNKVNIWREVESGGAGLVSDDTEEGACRLLKSYVDMSEADKISMCQATRKCFERHFEIEKAAENLYSVLAGAVRDFSSEGEHASSVSESAIGHVPPGR